MTKTTLQIRIEAHRKTDWEQAAKDAGLNLNEWIVLSLDASVGEPELVGKAEEGIDLGSQHAPAEVIERRQAEIEAPTLADALTPVSEEAKQVVEQQPEDPGAVLRRAATDVREGREAIDPHFKPDFKK